MNRRKLFGWLLASPAAVFLPKVSAAAPPIMGIQTSPTITIMVHVPAGVSRLSGGARIVGERGPELLTPNAARLRMNFNNARGPSQVIPFASRKQASQADVV